MRMLLLWILAVGFPPEEPPPVGVWGLQIGVQDVSKTESFYRQLGFTVERRDPARHFQWSILSLGEARLLLTADDRPPAEGSSARVYLNLQVTDLEAASALARRAGGDVDPPKPIVIGRSVAVRDPSGNSVNLIDIEGREPAAGTALEVFNVGFQETALEPSEGFFAKLGFTVFSRDYLPATLPFERLGAVSVVMHTQADGTAPRDRRRNALVLVTEDLDRAESLLPGRGLEPRDADTAIGPAKRALELETPSGNLLRVLPAEVLRSES